MASSSNTASRSAADAGVAALRRALPPSLALAALPGARRRGLVAAAAAARGAELLREAALLWQPRDGAALLVAAAAPGAAHVDALLCAAAPFYGGSAGGGEALPKLPVRSDGDGNSGGKEEWRGTYSLATGSARALIADRVCDVNALRVVEGEDDGEDAESGRGFFPLLGLVNHSCAPNAAITQCSFAGALRDASSPPAYALTARREIAAGDEITYAYVPRAWPLARRRAALEASYGFVCECERCPPSGIDDVCVLRCRAPACAHAGRVFLGAAACADCGAPAAAADQARLVAAGGSEALLEQQLDADTGAPLAERAASLLRHELLAHEDAALFARLCALLGELQEVGEGHEALLDEVAHAVAQASLRTTFTTPSDLGIEIEET
jgi:hypothetical protein